MKSITLAELRLVVAQLDTCKYFQVEDYLVTNSGLALALGDGVTRWWLWLEMSAICPLALLFEGRIPARMKHEKKPIGLFVEAHLLGAHFLGARLEEEMGRLMRLDFLDEKDVTANHQGAPQEVTKWLEIRLFPHGQNIIVWSQGKRISWTKIKELVPQETATTEGAPTRTTEEMAREWYAPKTAPSAPNGAQFEKPERLTLKQEDSDPLDKERRHNIKKKEKALQKMRDDLSLKGEKRRLYQQTGIWLKEHATLDVPEEFLPYVDAGRSLGDNIESCFTKTKELERKMGLSKARLTQVEKELERLAAGERPQDRRVSSPHNRQKEKTILRDNNVKARKLTLGENLEAYMGKSGRDNLAILRRAKPWYLWLHLKDLPSAHAIIHRSRGVELSEQQLQTVATWLASESMRQKKSGAPIEGEKVQVLIAECRHVTPIKGDRLGRVYCHNERVLTIKIKKI